MGGTGRPAQFPTTPAPAGPPGPLRWELTLLEQRGWVPGITHPVYPPCIPHRGTTLGPYWRLHGSHVTAGTVRGSLGTCTYDRFEDTVGEPRGIEHTPIFRVLDGILNGHSYSLKLGTFRVLDVYRHEVAGRSILVISEVNI